MEAVLFYMLAGTIILTIAGVIADLINLFMPK